MTPESSPDVPVATYRLQLHRGFDFEAASRVVPYLRDLGVSHLYLSPIWMAAPGSTHGYDVTDHARVNEELGGLAAFYAFCGTAREHGLRVVLDIVPNHVGIAHHPWWRDVLRYGPQSPFAAYFDIDWEGQPQLETGVLVYPVLGRPFGAALEAGELKLEYNGAELVVSYYDRTFPVSPPSYAAILGLAPAGTNRQSERDVLEVLAPLATATPQSAEILLGRLAECLRADPELRNWADERVRALNGVVGSPESFSDLEAILRKQHYRLAYWRVSAEEINYRRFFDINDLAAIRVEHEPVFAATHSLVREIVASGLVAGLRIDHIDGLYDPGDYLARLRQLVDGSPGGPIAIWVEKILARNELLPSHWPIEGTTGYDFLAVAGGLFVDPATEQAFTAIYREFAGMQPEFAVESFAARRRVAGRSFAGEVMVLALHLYRLAQRRRLARDNTLGALREAIAALLSTMPVYRTYLDRDEPMEADAELIRGATDAALRRDPNITPEAMAFLAQVLLVQTGDSRAQDHAEWVHFRRRFQQLSGPVMAKGVEDTAFFRYHRLLACNEVGDDPARFGVSTESAHNWFANRAATWPLSLSATTTHDTKRSEDARMRLAALTGVPRVWRQEVRSWARSNVRHRRIVRDYEVPDPNTEYYLYQSLVASWEGLPDQSYIGRIEMHMVKAAREAKTRTSWTRVDDEYESSLRAFTRAILDRRRSPAFLKRVDDFVAVIEPAASTNSLGLLALKITAPGIPDFFQGSESPLHTLTDPDNRGDVDYGRAQALIGAIGAKCPAPTDPSAKAWMTMRLLGLRRRYTALFTRGAYHPLVVSGPFAENLFAFQRVLDGSRCATVFVRAPSASVERTGHLRASQLRETTIELLPATTWRDCLSGERFHGGRLTASDVLAAFPVAVLVADEESDDA